MELTADNVSAVFTDCLFTDAEVAEDRQKAMDSAVKVHGVMILVGFHPGRLESHREDVRAMLDALPTQFFPPPGGGGWTFLNLCQRADGVQWGEHPNCDELVTLGIGLGMVSFLAPREMWSSLPGGMPYVLVTTAQEPKS